MAKDERRRATPKDRGLGKEGRLRGAAEAVGDRIAGAAEAVGEVVGGVAGAVGDTLTPGGDRAAHHHGAKAHGRPATVDETLPATRDELVELHAAARRRRATASLGSAAYREAADEIGRIEIRIAAIERDQVPPRV